MRCWPSPILLLSRYPSALASSAGSQSFVVANLGGGTANNLVYLNGNSVTFTFGSQANNSVSASQTATVANIGNQPMTLSNNSYYNPNPIPGFGLQTGSTCANGDIYTSLTSCLFAVEFHIDVQNLLRGSKRAGKDHQQRL